MAAPIFKFKNVRVPITTAATDTLIYAVDIGRGQNGLDIGVLPEEVSSVVLTIQCANTWTYIDDKLITEVSAVNNRFTCADSTDLEEGMMVTFRDTSYGGVTLGKKYYVVDKPTATTFTISETIGGAEYVPTGSSAGITDLFIDIDSSVKVTAKVIDLLTNTQMNLVKDYSVAPSNAFDPLNGNLILTSKLGLYISAEHAGVVNVTVSLLEIANATAT